jgi:hypothetical protein
MHASNISTVNTAYGLSFAIEDLVLLRSWAEQRQLRLTVTLDQLVDGSEFEEMLVVAPPGGHRRTLTVWCTSDAIFAQTATGAPQAFPSMQDLLDQLRPARAHKAGWLQRLGLG